MIRRQTMIRTLVIPVLALLSLAGCVIVPDGHYYDWHDAGRYHHHHQYDRR